MTYAVTLEAPRTRAGLGQAVRAEWTQARLAALHGVGAPHHAGRDGARELPVRTRGARHTHAPAGFFQGFDPTNAALAGLALGIARHGGPRRLVHDRRVRERDDPVVARGNAAALRLLRRQGHRVRRRCPRRRHGDELSVVLRRAGRALRWCAHGDAGRSRASCGSWWNPAAFLALLALFAVGLGAIIRHSAGAIAAFVGCTLLLPLLLHGVPGNVVRLTPESIFANSVADVVPTNGALSSTTGFLLMAGYAAVALARGRILLARRDA